MIALAVMAIGLVLALGAVAYALNSHQVAVHDERIRGAQQAAVAGTQSQLYVNSGASSLGFNLNGGALGVSQLLDCTIPKLSAGVVIGTVQVSANASGTCPPACVVSGSTCSTPTGSTGTWEPVSNQTYQESEFFANAVPQQSSGSSNGNGDDVLFPSIVSIGCRTLAASNPTTSCNQGTSTNSYFRQLTLLQPTGPLQAIEGRNDVTVNSGLSNLTSQLTSAVNSQCVIVLGLVVSCPSTSGLLSGLSSLLSSIISLLGLGNTVNNVVAKLENSVTGLGVIDANISAGNRLWLPSTTVDVNTSTGTLSPGLTNLGGVLSNLTSTLANPSSLFSTFAYGSQVCKVGSGSSCTSSPTAGFSGSPVVAVQPNYVNTSGKVCAAGSPSQQCTLVRQTFKLSTGPAASLPSGISYTGTGTLKYANGMLTVTGDTGASTITFQGGSAYTLCGIEADSNVTLATGGSGGVQIYVEAPGQNGCPSTGTNAAAGSVVVCGGLNNTLSSGGLNAVTGVVNPSGLQIYVQGNTNQYSAGSTLSVGSTDTAVSSCPWNSSGSGSYTAGLSSVDPATQVYLGGSGNSLLQSAVIYAPDSEVNLQTTAAFEGSLIGWNVNVTALAILQDLDLGNYPLSPVIGAYQPAQTLTCDNSIEALSYTQSGNPVQNYGTGAPTSSGGTGDLNGC